MLKKNYSFILKIFYIASVTMATRSLDFQQRFGIIIATISLFTWLEISFMNLKNELTDPGDNKNI